ncbi:AAA family ATPase [Candidatus Bathyarchaeota archaeon]|nr:AAA family ATPase [Candidatus Bathyarchaeota archaeon]
MKVKLVRTVFIKGEVYEEGTVREVDDSLGKWMIDKGIAEPAEKAVAMRSPIKVKPKVETEETAYDKLMRLAEAHLVEIYGAYGTGKSRLMHHIAVEAQNAGKRVLFIDTEGGLTDRHVKQLQNYWYVGDSIEALEDAVSWAKKNRNSYDLLIVDSVGHPVYVNYVELESMQDKLRAYQRLATIFRDMVRFARGERGVDFDPKNPLESKRRALAIATNHTVSEFARVAKNLPPEEPLNPFGGQIHRVPKVILRSEPVLLSDKISIFKLLSFKVRDMPKNVEVARFTIDDRGVKINWKI